MVHLNYFILVYILNFVIFIWQDRTKNWKIIKKYQLNLFNFCILKFHSFGDELEKEKVTF